MSSWIWRFLSPLGNSRSHSLFLGSVTAECWPVTVQGHAMSYIDHYVCFQGKIITFPSLGLKSEMAKYTECVLLWSFFLFPSSCGCVARLLDSDPNNQVPGESKQQKRLSVQAVTSPLRNERAAVSHLCDPFSFLPLSWIKHCTCPWGGNICHTYWSAWMQIHTLFKNVYSLLFFFLTKMYIRCVVSSPFGAHAGLSSAPVNLLCDYLGLKVRGERRFEVFIHKPVHAKQQQSSRFCNIWSGLEFDLGNIMGLIQIH